MCVCVCVYIYTYKVFKEKTKTIFTENISATAFINSLLYIINSLYIHTCIHKYINTNIYIYIYIYMYI